MVGPAALLGHGATGPAMRVGTLLAAVGRGHDPLLPEPPGALTALDSPTVDVASVREPAGAPREVPDSPEPEDQACREHPERCPATPCNAHLVHFLTIEELNATHQRSDAVPPTATPKPIYLRYGAVVDEHTDLLVSGPVPGWAGSRTYSSRVTGSDALGGSWVGNFLDYRLVHDAENFKCSLIVDSTSQVVFYELPMEFLAMEDSPFTLEGDWGNDQLVLTNWATSEVFIFYDFESSYPGRLKEKTTRAWRADGQEGVLFTYNGSEQLTQITTADGQDYNVVPAYTGDRITEIEVRTGGDTSTRVQEVTYTYFDSQVHSADLGSDGDLVQVTISALRSGGSPGTSADWIHRYYQYRYDSNGLLKGVFQPDAIERMISDRADIDDTDDILAKGDDDDNSGTEDYSIQDYASRWFTYYDVDLKTDNTGAGTSQDPKCVTVWAPSGENLQSKYGGSDADEVDSGSDKYLVKSETVGGCSSCGSGTGSVKYEYFYMQLDHNTPDPNEVVWLVVEDLSDAEGNGIRRNVYGLNDSGRGCGKPPFWTRPARRSSGAAPALWKRRTRSSTTWPKSARRRPTT